MLVRQDNPNRDIIENVAKLVRRKDKDDALAEFIGSFFARAAREDLNQFEASELAGAAQTAWAHLQQRTRGKPSIQITNPDITAKAEFGYPVAVTLIDIVNDNMPFLVDSITDEIADRGIKVHLVMHPILTVTRTPKGRLKTVSRHPAERGSDELRESVIQLHIDRIEHKADRDEIQKSLLQVLTDVRRSVEDWGDMRARLNHALDMYKTNPPPLPVDEIAEAASFLDWLLDDNFTFIGMREYAFEGPARSAEFKTVKGSNLGILRDPEVRVLRRGRELVVFTPELREFLMQPVPLIVTKANVRSRVHRKAHLDYIGVKLYSSDGELSGELRVVGLFTSSAYTRSSRSMPLLRRKVDYVLRSAGYDPDGHSGKALLNVLEQFPRDELFQIDQETLADFALSILQLEEHPRLRILYRIDKFDRFVSVLAYLPRDRFDSTVRARVGEYLADAFEGRISAFYPAFLDALVRIHFIIGRYEGDTPTPEQAQLEADIWEIVRSWDDNVRAQLASAFDADTFREVRSRYTGAFNIAYQEAYDAAKAVQDIRNIEQLSEAHPIAISFFAREGFEDRPDRVSLQVLHHSAPIPLSARVPMLENMGFSVINERSYRISPEDRERTWLHDMTVEHADAIAIDLDRLGDKLRDCFTAVWAGEAENDGYNALVLRAGLSWRDVSVLRAYSRYLRQTRIPFSQDYMWNTLNRHAAIAAELAALFETRFNPKSKLSAKKRDEQVRKITGRIEDALQDVDSLDEDRIIRRFVNLIMVTLRTNVFQHGPEGEERPAMAFKISSRQVDDLPEPKPYAEISVYSPRVEGVHIRFGMVARGGLRWSDRPQDFRTEVLGLVKAQQVKNAVIVPVGAKGGFVPKRLPDISDREAFMQEGIDSYKIFIGSLLDVTDNLDGDKVVPPEEVVRRDGDDPYLVVAADKGTATFSDIANSISQSRDFWLDDAFASGGSAGYDHKKMGITARGAWEAVKRHFREMDRDIQSEPFTVIGCGDMSGDVFGNGMLLSEQIRLVAAFNHLDIFIDPDPDPVKSFAERKRLFDLPRSTWQDYDKSLISEGGGVFSRREKSIPLSPQMQALTGLSKSSASPFEIINGMLKADADLLWFGGIGTYVRASGESDDAVGDRANDAIRVTAEQLRAKVVGEGANLGMTQKARIEFALAGGRVNSDAIDNSAGVNSSDMEVNIKIALGQVVRAGNMTIPQRNKLLARMTSDVAELVLRNNYLQTLAISLAERAGMEDFGFQQRFMQDLERAGHLDRQVEDLPNDAVLAERDADKEPFTRPELAVLLAYAKITLYDELLDSTVPDDAYLSRELMRYFPPELQKKHADAIESHRLRREIIATMLANSMINRGGPSFVNRVQNQTDATIGEIAAAYAVARDSFELSDLNGQIDALDNQISGALQLALYARLQDLLRDQVYWFLRNASFEGGLAVLIKRYHTGIEALYSGLDTVLPDDARARLDEHVGQLVEQGVPAKLARRLSATDYLSAAPDMVLVAEETRKSIPDVARVFFAVMDYFDTDRLYLAAQSLEIDDYFDRLAMDRALEGLNDSRRQLTALAVKTGKTGTEALEQWAKSRGIDLERTRRAVKEIAGDGALTLSKLAVGTSLLQDLIRK